jgi:pimeloyl-ACP methyl ester carboxylesterase
LSALGVTGTLAYMAITSATGVRLFRTLTCVAALSAIGAGCGSSAPHRPVDMDDPPADPTPDAADRPDVARPRMADASPGADALAAPDGQTGEADVQPVSADGGASDGNGSDAVPPAAQLEPAPCGFPAPAGRTVSCGFVTVPENRALPGGRLVKVFVARLKAKTAQAGLPPLLYAEGGPGISGTESVSGSFGAPEGGDFLPLAETRDLLFFDARGTGRSTPALSCPAPTRPDADETQVAQECWKQLAGMGIDLAQYETLAVADDIDDVRRAIGERQLDLLGVSYGTRVVLEVLRRHPGGVRAAVVDSVLTPEIDLLAQTEPSVYRALKLAFDGCAADAACKKAYPALETVLVDLLHKLAAQPPMLTLTGGRKVPLDDQTFMHFLTERLMEPAGVAGIPEVVFQTRDKKYAIITRDLERDEPPPGAAPEPNYDGVYNTVICADEAPFTTAQAITAAAAVIPASLRPYFVEGRLRMCSGWPVPAAPASANAAVTGDVPTLFLSGEIDPVTPPAWAQAAARTLSHGHFVFLPGLSHGTMGTPCAHSILDAFFANPAVAPAAACAPKLPPVKFHITR